METTMIDGNLLLSLELFALAVVVAIGVWRTYGIYGTRLSARINALAPAAHDMRKDGQRLSVLPPQRASARNPSSLFSNAQPARLNGRRTSVACMRSSAPMADGFMASPARCAPTEAVRPYYAVRRRLIA